MDVAWISGSAAKRPVTMMRAMEWAGDVLKGRADATAARARREDRMACIMLREVIVVCCWTRICLVESCWWWADWLIDRGLLDAVTTLRRCSHLAVSGGVG